MRAIFNFMWERHLGVHLVWVPTALQPADPLSRLASVSTGEVVQAVFDLHSRLDALLRHGHLAKSMGFVHL